MLPFTEVFGGEIEFLTFTIGAGTIENGTTKPPPPRIDPSL